MIPYIQTKLGEEGNCFETCLASVLEIPQDSVPYLGKDENEWFENARAFVAQFNYDFFAALFDPSSCDKNYWPFGDNTIFIAGGESHRGLKHAVVYKGRNMLHDPHPEQTGLATIDIIFVLIPIDPALRKDKN